MTLKLLIQFDCQLLIDRSKFIIGRVGNDEKKICFFNSCMDAAGGD